MLRIIVLMKVVLDPEAPVWLYQVDSAAKKIIPPKGTPPVLNPFDENALEAALKIKDSQGASITVLSLGNNISKQLIRKSLALGADNLILAEDEIFEGLDSYSTATALSKAIQKIGEYNLILCGREAADTDGGQVGLGIAELLGIPCVSLARDVEIKGHGLKVTRVLPDGSETIEVSLPALVTVSSEVGVLRTARLPNIIAAQKKPITIWSSKDIGVSLEQLRKFNLYDLFIPHRETKCDIITADSQEAAAVKLAGVLRDAKIL